jgi:hypothetical protein
MKTSYPSLSVLFLLFSFSILFVSCSQESTITAPNENKVTPLAKAAVVPTGSINHLTDTVITFPKSGKTLSVSKSYTANQLAQIDNYLATHNIPVVKSLVVPNALSCYQRWTYNYIMENRFEPADQKNIGIWCDYLTPAQCLNYGFNQYFVYDFSNINLNINSAITAGYQAANIMASLGGNYTNALSYINGITSLTPNVGYYYVDEPAETNSYTTDQIYNFYTALAANPYTSGSKLCMSSYNELMTFYYTPIHLSEPNALIMCDEYHGNVLGDVTNYWDWFNTTYTYNSHMNFMHIVINNGTGGGHNTWTSNNSSSWYDLFTKANGLGQNHVWLYAAGTGNEDAIINFCIAAWQSEWMYRYQSTLATLWRCSGDCTTCNWPYGSWTIVEANIVLGGQWISF